MSGGQAQDGCLPTIAMDCPESSGRGGVQEGEKTWGEKTRPQSPALSRRMEIPCPSESSRGPKMGTERQPQGAWGPCGALIALPIGSFHLKGETRT